MPTTKLVATFQTEDGKMQTWSYETPNTSKTAEEMKETLERITQLNLFQRHGIRQFAAIQSAEFITTKETTVF
ncbi:DUF2922 family protein [Enterococcus sp. AZ163]|uniref:DUF2922 family protein n=1 Tax=Enterococcus sp. AZ163 TaxID=2774638 RepID=UPI003D2B0EF7